MKKYIADCMANQLGQKSNYYLRMAIQEIMLKEFAHSESSQMRQIFLLFLETLLPQISKVYFKQIFQESYFMFKEDTAHPIVLHFIRLAPLVRFKLEDLKSQEKLETSLLHLNNIYSQPNKRAGDILEAIEDVSFFMKSDDYINQIGEYL